jgi:hypothetical protein
MDGIDYCSLGLVMDMVHGYQSQWMGLITAHWFYLWFWFGYGSSYGYGTWILISMDGIDYCSL